jgi:hypothetical protein
MDEKRNGSPATLSRDIDVRTILKRMLKECDGVTWTAFICLRRGTGGRLL